MNVTMRQRGVLQRRAAMKSCPDWTQPCFVVMKVYFWCMGRFEIFFWVDTSMRRGYESLFGVMVGLQVVGSLPVEAKKEIANATRWYVFRITLS